MSAGSASVRVRSSKGLSESGSTRSTRFRFLSWSPETYSIREFLTSFPLPRVVRLTNCEEANLLKTLLLPPDVDITQPLLFFKKYRPTKIMAKCLKAHKNGKWKETGPSVVIPDSFSGWFTLLNPDGRECAMTLTSMGQVAAARVPAFLTKFDVPVYKLTESNDPSNKSVYIRSHMKAGSVLRLLGVWADLGGGNACQPQKSSNFLGGSLGGFGGRLVARSLSLQNTQPQQFQYVQCLSLDNEVLFIPFHATGVFYPIAPRGGRNPQHIYPLSAIARIHRLPLRVKMVYGVLPPNIPEFTGAIQIDRIDTEDVVLACTLMREKPLLFEIDLDCDLLLSQMTSEDLFIQSTGYQTALQFCRSEADSYRRQVRVYPLGPKSGKGTMAGSFLNSMKEKNRSLRLRAQQATPSKLSLLFRPSSAPFGNNKDPLRRTKSFNVEVQSVSMSLGQDEEEEETRRLSTLFNFIAGKKTKSRQSIATSTHAPLPMDKEFFYPRDEMSHSYGSENNVQSVGDIMKHKSVHPSKLVKHANKPVVPDVLSNKPHFANGHFRSQCQPQRHVLSLHCSGNSSGLGNSLTNSSSGCSSLGNLSYGHCSLSLSPLPTGSPNSSGGSGSPDVPYGTVADEIENHEEDENIYSEISDALKLSLNPIHRMGLNFHKQLQLQRQNSSNMSSLLKGGGGSDGTFSGTFSSSNPSNRDEDIYDAVF